MCIKALEVDPWQLKDVPDHFKIQDMRDKAMRDDALSLVCVPDWFVTQQQLKIWDDDDTYCNDNELIKWYEDHQNARPRKHKLKKS